MSAIWASTSTVFLHSLSLVNKYVILIEPIRNAAHVCHPRINKQSALFWGGWFIASRECPLPTDWSVHWLHWPSFPAASNRDICVSTTENTNFWNSLSIYVHFVSQNSTLVLDRKIRKSFWIYGFACFEATKRSPTYDREFITLVTVHITMQSPLAYVNHTKSSLGFSNAFVWRELCNNWKGIRFYPIKRSWKLLKIALSR